MSLDWQARFGLRQEAAHALTSEMAALEHPKETLQALERLLEKIADSGAGMPEEATSAKALVRLAYAAPFLVRYLTANPLRLQEGLLEGLATDRESGGAARESALSLLPWSVDAPRGGAVMPTDGDFLRALRHWKYDNYVRITAGELLESHSTADTCRAISELADGMIRGAYRYAFAAQVRRQGIPLDEGHQPAFGAVLGMGKLGGRELNYASDVDLIFIHEAGDAPCLPIPPGVALPEPTAATEETYWGQWANLARTVRGASTGVEEGARVISGGEFHNHLARQAIRLLSDKTAEGIGFRVDVDLRPLGRSGLLSQSVAFLSHYYESQGREWERTAMLKARCVTGSPGVCASFHQTIRPFVYRRYLDFGAVEGVAIVKHDINRNHSHALAENLKLGPGGIRENEFFIQALQLLYGGRDPSLQVTSHQEAIRCLSAAGVLSGEDAAAHLGEYWLMRRHENRLQMVEESQTHDLPTTEPERMRIFHDFKPGFSDRLSNTIAALESARSRTGERFRQLFAGMGPEELPEAGAWQKAMEAHLPPEQRSQALERVDGLLTRLMKTRQGERCVLKLERILTEPELYRVGMEPVLPRWLEFLEQIGNRNSLYSLIASHPEIVPRVTRVFTEGGHHAKSLIRHPEYLESYVIFSDALPSGLTEFFLKILPGARDEEEFILELRMAKSQAMLQILTAYLNTPNSTGHRALLSELAEATVTACTAWAWRTVGERYGLPEKSGGGELAWDFAVLAMGKLGSREMHFGSDLDLAFVYTEEGTTSKGKSHYEFYTKLTQKIGTLLTSQTQFGNLYEIDHRLRPFGAKGMLVPSLGAFTGFLDEAEVWNFQAFTRLRFLCGDPTLGGKVTEAVRQSWQARGLPVAKVAGAVWHMLSRLVGEHGAPREGDRKTLALKYSIGGLMGFEFLRQFHFLKAQLDGAPGWTAPPDHATILPLRALYQTLSALDERLSFYDERHQHRVSSETFERLPGLEPIWPRESIWATSADLEAGVTAAFQEQMK